MAALKPPAPSPSRTVRMAFVPLMFVAAMSALPSPLKSPIPAIVQSDETLPGDPAPMMLGSAYLQLDGDASGLAVSVEGDASARWVVDALPGGAYVITALPLGAYDPWRRHDAHLPVTVVVTAP